MPLHFIPPLPDIDDAPWLNNIWNFVWGDMTRYTPKIPWDGLTPPPGQPEGMDKLMESNRRSLKRDKVYGMCAETRRAHREADKKRWHVGPPFGDKKYSRALHIRAYAEALGVCECEAYDRIDHQFRLIDWANCE